MWRLRRQRVSERELGDAPAYLTGSFPLTIETPGAIALQVLNAVFYGLDLEELQNFRERVNAVTVEDIQRVASTYLHPDRLSIVLVGDASQFQQGLAGVGFDEVERIAVADLDLSSPTLRRAPRTGRLEPAGVRSAPALRPIAFRPTVAAPAGTGAVPAASTTDIQALIDRAVRAKGGLEKLKSIRTVRAVTDVTMQTPGGPVTIPTTIRVRYPGAFRVDAEMPAGPVVQVFDSGTYWVRDARGVKVAPDGAAESIRGQVQRDPIALLVALSDGRVKAARTPDVTVDGRRMPALVVNLEPAGPLTLVLHPDTGLIVRGLYEASGGRVEESFSEYRDVQGLQVAFSVEVRHQTLPSLTRVIRQFEYNVPLDPALFARPS